MKNINLYFIFIVLFFIPTNAFAESNTLKKLYLLNSIIQMRSNPILNYIKTMEATGNINKESQKIAYGAIILTSNIYHAGTINTFSTALISLQEAGKEKSVYAYESSKFIFDNYRKSSFLTQTESISSMLKVLITYPEPISTFASDTLRDFEECKKLILDYK